jgi:hypothetical protein
MKIEKATAGSGTTNEAKRNIVASIEFAVRASLHEEYVDADFVHSILGKISAKSEGSGRRRGRWLHKSVVGAIR